MKAVEDLLDALGEDKTREGLRDTPRRVADAYAEMLSGYDADTKAVLGVTFEADGTDVVLERDIPFSSLCEHHLMPFFGKVSIAYIPNGKVVGLSKLSRVVDAYSKRLQIQERMTGQIADEIMDVLNPRGVMVVCEAEHTCMTCRGVKKIGSTTLTVRCSGDFPQERREEVLRLLGK